MHHGRGRGHGGWGNAPDEQVFQGQVAQGQDVSCKAGHHLNQSFNPYNGRDWKCDGCGVGGGANAPVFHCGQCNFDLCLNCANGGRAPAPAAPQAVVCKAGHPLGQSSNPYNGRDWKCDGCGVGGGANAPVFHCGQCNFDLCLNCGNGVQNQHENVEEGHGGGHGRWGQGGAGFGRGGGVGRRRFGRDGEHRHHQEQGKLHESKFVPGRKHDFGRLGGHKFSTHQGLYGSKLDSGAQHTTIPASAVAQQYESFDADVKAKVESKVAKINLETGRSLAKSDLTGNKKALLIGCNYIGSKNELKGCVNDVMNMKKFIISTFGFQDDPNHLRVLLNDECTRVKMIYLMQWLVEGAKAGDSLFLHYSGHGATQPDKGPVLDEPTGMDETIVPFDYEQNGMITDDELHDLLVKNLPSGVRLTVVSDCCHSGSILDLPFTYVLPNGRDLPVEIDNRKVILASALAAGQAFMAHDSATAILELMKAGASALALHDQSVAAQPEKKHSALGSFVSQIAHLALDGQQSAAAPNVSAPQQTSTSSGGFQHAVKEEVVQIRTSLADVVQFSGCRDDQTSADAYIGGVSQGAMTYALLKSFETHGTEISFANLLRSLREILQKGQYKQVPMLSTGMQTEDMNELFWL